MATVKTEINVNAPAARDDKRSEASNQSVLDQALCLFSSVRFGILMLMLLLSCCIIGMVIMQQNVEGFRAYYARLSPAQSNLYETLGFFDIYHSWYFTLLLAMTGMNIILSSIDRFPAAWAYLRKPKVAASPKFIRAQMFNRTAAAHGNAEAFAECVAAIWRKAGLRSRIHQSESRITVFAERNAWNRLGAYFVHVALLLIFAGGFLTSRYGVGGAMEITPGQSSNAFMTFENQLHGEQVKKAQMPFAVECTDLRQELIRPEGGLDVMNTIDWLSYIKIKDNGAEATALVHLNAPFDYRGYRFFQSSFLPQGYARQITLSFTPAGGGPAREVTIERDGSTDVEGIGHVAYTNFYPDFTDESGRPDTASGDYNNPVAEIRVSAPDGKTERVYAFTAQALDQAPHAAASQEKNEALVAGNQVTLKRFEKVALSHTLTVQYDPGRMPVYIGFMLLVISLCGVFFFSHQRVWAVIEPDGKQAKVYFGGNTNRNRPTFEGRFNTLVQSVIGRAKAEQSMEV
jgi:cytochrome c biogenesis protein